MNWCDVAISANVPSIADGGALNHRNLIEKQKFKLCKQINQKTSAPLLAILC